MQFIPAITKQNIVLLLSVLKTVFYSNSLHVSTFSKLRGKYLCNSAENI